MHGDFSRWTHVPARHYTGVLKQQGRVELDADANEQVAIDQQLRRALTADVIGPSGAPLDGGGFAISASTTEVGGPRLTISPGRFYVAGILCQLDEETDYTQQPDYPLTDEERDTALDLGELEARTDLVYLDVWQRHITAIEDPHLRDPALRGLDTTTRLQTICQVKVEQGVSDEDASCEGSLPAEVVAPSDGRLTSSFEAPSPEDDPCVVAPGGGYRGLENRLYRVEIHRSGPLDGGAEDPPATFKWSRDNGAVVYRVTSFETEEATTDAIKIAQLGRDEVLALKTGDWVELRDDRHDLRGEPGLLVQIKDVIESQRRVLLESEIDVSAFDLERRPKLRRWDGAGEDGAGIPVSSEDVDLEDGIRVHFSGARFDSGDFWFFPARAAASGEDAVLLQDAPPAGVEHHYAKLAVVRWERGDEGEIGVDDCDCRTEFSPLSGRMRLLYVGGDGQQADANGALPQSLEVAVFNGAHPIEAAQVQFEILEGVGGLLQSGGETDPESVIALTNDQGIATCDWTLRTAPDDPAPPRSQQVQATLIGCHRDDARPPIRFNASLGEIVLRYVGGDGQEAGPGSFVPGRLRVGVEDSVGRPLANVRVDYEVLAGGGQIRLPGGALTNNLPVDTDANGLAECEWELGTDPNEVNFVSARLASAPQGPSLPAVFRGAVVIPAAGEGGLCTVTLGVDGVNDLRQALKLLPPEGGCICVPSGRFIQPGSVEIVDRRRITIEGCGSASEIVFDPQEREPLFFVDESEEIRFEHLGFVGGEHASDFVQFARATACGVRDCTIQSRQSGISAPLSGPEMVLRGLEIERCRFEGQQAAIRIMPEGGVVEGLVVRGNQMEQVDEGIAIRNMRSIQAFLVDNTIRCRVAAIRAWGEDLLVAGNRIAAESDQTAVDIFVSSEPLVVRVRDNQIVALKGRGMRVSGNPAQVDIADNHIEAMTQVLELYDSREANAERRTARARVAGNVFRSLSQQRDDSSVVQCGHRDDDTPGMTPIHQLLFTDNRVLSNRTPLQGAATVYLNALTAIVTTNFVEEPEADAVFSMIVEGIESERHLIVAHNLTRNGIRDVVATGRVTQPNVQLT